MRTEKLLLMGAAFLGGFAISNFQKKRKSLGALKGFIDEALGKGMVGIQNARLAIRNSKSTNLQIFAQKVADDYGTFNQRLIEIARAENIDIYDIEEYQRSAKALLMNYDNAVSLNQYYLDQSQKFNGEMINFLSQYENFGSAKLRELISSLLQQLSRHSQMACELSKTLHTNSIPTSSADLPLAPNQKATNH